jgi:hypothetical protein
MSDSEQMATEVLVTPEMLEAAWGVWPESRDVEHCHDEILTDAFQLMFAVWREQNREAELRA